MEIVLTKESAEKFFAFAEGVVTECYNRGLTEKEASAVLEQVTPLFVTTRTAAGLEGARSVVKSASPMSQLARAGWNGSKAFLRSLGGHAGATAATAAAKAPAAKAVSSGFAKRLAGYGRLGRFSGRSMLEAAGMAGTGLLAGTQNPVSEAMPDWMRDTLTYAGMGGAAGRLGIGIGGGRIGAAVGGLGGMASSALRSDSRMPAEGFLPSYVDPSSIASGSNVGIGDAGAGLRRKQQELQLLESQMAEIQARTRSGIGLSGSLEARLKSRELRELQKRHAELSDSVGRDLSGFETDQARARQSGADRLATINKALARQRELEAPLENLLARADDRSFGGLLNNVWARVSGAEQRAADLVARRRELEYRRGIENNRANLQLMPAGWNN